MNEDFWHSCEALIASSALVIDRPRDSAHPRYPEMRYPLDYGYLSETRAGDGAGIDVWVGTLPERRLVGLIVTVDLLKRESEIKLLLGCSADEVAVALAMHRSGQQQALLLRRDTLPTAIEEA